MKKILAIFSVVAMLFASCAQNETLPRPEFPEIKEITVMGGSTYNIHFTTEVAWTISLPAESQPYAKLRYDGYIDTRHSGPAGENVVTLHVNKGAGSYFNDITFNIDITMNRYTENLALCTIPKSTKVITVTGAPNGGFEESVKVDFMQGGHPENGPFATAPNRYSVRHKKGVDAIDANYYIQHNFDLLYNYVVYAKNAEGEFVDVTEDENSWLRLVSFGANDEKHRLYMNYTSGTITQGVGYEAYVNVEDADKNVIISVYYVYNPDDEVLVKTAMELANPELAAEKGVTLKGGGTTYTLTIPTSDIFTEHYAAAALRFIGYSSGLNCTIPSENLHYNYDMETQTLSVFLKEGATLDGLYRTNTWTVSGINDNDTTDEYTITAIFEWIPETDEEPIE